MGASVFSIHFSNAANRVAIFFLMQIPLKKHSEAVFTRE